MGVDRSTPPEDTGESRDDLVDVPLQQEIELVGALVAAVSAHTGALSDDEIDRLLGVHPGDSDAEAGEHQRESADQGDARHTGVEGESADPG